MNLKISSTPKTVLLFMLVLAFAACKDKAQNAADQAEKESDITTSESQLKSEELSYSSDTTEMKGYISYDPTIAAKKPGIIVIHEWWGHNEYVRERADMLAELGYVAFALDMYGDGKQAEHPDDAGKFAGMVFSNMDKSKAKFEAALEALKSNPHVDQGKIAAIGYCIGGSIALSMANAGYDLDAVAAFHCGINLPIAPSKDIKGKIFVANGADDPFIQEEDVNDFKAAMDAVEADYEYVSYEGATHAFTNKEADENGKKFGLPLAYNQQADEASWERLQNLLQDAFANVDTE